MQPNSNAKGATSKNEMSIDQLRRLLSYDPDTGNFYWKVSRGGAVRAGELAGTVNASGYIKIMICRRVFFAHRLAWAMHFGFWPSAEIDHINGIKFDNRLANLREASRQMNMQNQRRARRSNAAGFLGVAKDGSRWKALIGHGGKSVHLGMFSTPEEAHDAYLAAKRVMHAGGTL